MDAKERLELIARPPTEEVLVRRELKELIEQGKPLRHYVGYEVSGLVHLGQLLTAFKIADLQKAGADTSIMAADFHTVINDKLGGDAEFIRRVAREYFHKAMATGIKVAGGKPRKTKFVLASDIYDQKYWETVIRVSKETTLSRAMRSISIMGREEGESIPTAWLVYPMMQAADIFHQGVNIAHAGMDQRKIHVVAREVGRKVAGYKPVAVHNHMLLGLHKPPVWPIPRNTEVKWETFKMSKSVRGSAVFLTDSEKEIREKVRDAFCPAGGTEYNPVLDWVKHVVFAPQLGTRELRVERAEKHGGDVSYTGYGAVEKDFASGKLHPLDLKKALAEFMVKLLEPFRTKFQDDGLVADLKKRVTR
jgi:tyrosyl-tRNA synthetase